MKILAERGGWYTPACFARAARCQSSVSKHLLRQSLVSAYLQTGRKNAASICMLAAWLCYWYLRAARASWAARRTAAGCTMGLPLNLQVAAPQHVANKALRAYALRVRQLRQLRQHRSRSR